MTTEQKIIRAKVAGRFVSPFNLKRTTDAAAADLRRYL
jgi:hypothetical protein